MIVDSRPFALLVAEAHPLLRMLTAEMLSEAGFRTIQVRTVAEALAVLEEKAAVVRMLITGRNIVGDGVSLAHVVHRRWLKVGIIVTSGAGADLQPELPPSTRLLRKPYDFEDLFHEVEAELAQAQEKPSAAPVLLSDIPLHIGAEMSKGMGAVAAHTSEPDQI